MNGAGAIDGCSGRGEQAPDAGRTTRRWVGAPESLATIHAGERVVIESILFDSLRELLSDLGLRSGDEARCRANGQGFLFLEAGHGRVVSLELDWARFVAVRRLEVSPDTEYRREGTGPGEPGEDQATQSGRG